ncbi:MAG: hypothetical protein WKG01_26220 [Kofleriaceae bacterium]
MFRAALEAQGARNRTPDAPLTELVWQSCFGRCTQGPNVLVREILTAEPPSITGTFATLPGPRGTTALYNRVDSFRAEHIVAAHVMNGQIVREYVERPGIHPSDPVNLKDSE